jgi:tRNA threonylcarbamoyladenosine biosynthesis protein TsaE
MDIVLRTASADETRAVGEAVASSLRPNDAVVLTGELGAGKTTFVQGVAAGLGAEEHVTSPTFTLVREYVSGRLPVAHIDVYRLDRVQDVIDLALDELTGEDAVLLVEWGDAVEELLRDERLRVELTLDDGGPEPEARRIALTGVGGSWSERWGELEAALASWRSAP